MKFSFLVSSILLGATARTATATGCCLADETLGCPTDYEESTSMAGSVINGVPVVLCCPPDAPFQISGEPQLCSGTVAPNTGVGTTTTTVTSGRSLFDGDACCFSDEKIGCPTDYEDVPVFGTVTINGVQSTKQCCPGSSSQDDNMQLCPGMVAPTTTTDTTEGFDGSVPAGAGETLSCEDQDELRSQLPGCSCVILCPNEAPQCQDGTICGSAGLVCKGMSLCNIDGTLNDDVTGSGAGILSSASSTYIGASVAIIAIFV